MNGPNDIVDISNITGKLSPSVVNQEFAQIEQYDIQVRMLKMTPNQLKQLEWLDDGNSMIDFPKKPSKSVTDTGATLWGAKIELVAPRGYCLIGDLHEA